MAIKVQRGFNRLFAVLTCVWVVYVLIGIPIQERRAADELRSGVFKDCLDMTTPSPPFKTCSDMAEKISQPRLDEWTIKNYYKTRRHLIAGGVIVLPMIVYGLIRGLGSICVWVFRGFSGTS
jgi:hypothetical protein